MDGSGHDAQRLQIEDIPNMYLFLSGDNPNKTITKSVF